MFEIVFGAVCLGVLVVEVIEVRQKCEEPHHGMWHGVSLFQSHLASPKGVLEKGASI